MIDTLLSFRDAHILTLVLMREEVDSGFMWVDFLCDLQVQEADGGDAEGIQHDRPEAAEHVPGSRGTGSHSWTTTSHVCSPQPFKCIALL